VHRGGDVAEGGKPDLATRVTPGGVPSIAPAEGEGTVETAPAKRTAAKKAAPGADATVEGPVAAEAPAAKAAAKKAPAKKAAPDTAAEAAKAPVEQAEAANAGPDATAPSEDGATDTTEEKA
jgi:large subunit ribosomal protein L4